MTATKNKTKLHLSERKKKQPAIQIKKGDRSLPKIN